jgi:hypothetical protein
MERWVRGFGALFIVAATLWVFFTGFAAIRSPDDIEGLRTVVELSAVTGATALASFGATIVCLAVQWSQRLSRTDPSNLWHEPRDTR